MNSELREDSNEYSLDIQVPGCRIDDLKIQVNKVHIQISALLDISKLISTNDSTEEYLKNVPDVICTGPMQK